MQSLSLLSLSPCIKKSSPSNATLLAYPGQSLYPFTFIFQLGHVGRDVYLDMALSTTLFLSALLFAPALARFDLARRLVCTQDDVYSLFHSATPSWIDPWCSSYIGLTDVQSTSNAYTNQLYGTSIFKAETQN